MGECDRYIRINSILIEEDCLESAKLEGRAKGIVEGIVQGRAEGRAEAQVEMAKKLKSIGVPSDIIIKATRLSFSEIDQP